MAELELAQCRNCGNDFPKPAREHRGVYCSRSCHLSARKPGHQKCQWCGCLFTPLKINKGRNGARRLVAVSTVRKSCSLECKMHLMVGNKERSRKLREAARRTSQRYSKGGETRWFTSSRGSRWKEISEKVRNRDGRVCVECGCTEDQNGRAMDVHHLVPVSNFQTFAQANRLSNLVSLCRSCHIRIEHQTTNVQAMLPLFGRGNGFGRAAGERAGTAKLTREIVADMRRRAHRGEACSDLAREYGVTPSAGWAAVTGKTWRSLESPPPVELTAIAGSRHKLARLDDESVREARKLYAQGVRLFILARRYGVARGTIKKAIKRETWSHVN